MTNVLLLAVLFGAASASLTVILRAAPFINRWTLAGIKPWVCDICMTLWTTLLIAGACYTLGEPRAALAWLPSYATGLFVLHHITGPSGPPPELPLDMGGDDDDGRD